MTKYYPSQKPTFTTNERGLLKGWLVGIILVGGTLISLSIIFGGGLK